MTAPLDADALAALRKLDAAATTAPWTVRVETEGSDAPEDGLVIAIDEIGRALHDHDWADSADWPRDLANAQLIVAMRNALLSLLADAEALRDLRALLPEMEQYFADRLTISPDRLNLIADVLLSKVARQLREGQ